MTRERWLPAPGYEGVYSVSTQGHIRRDVASSRLKAGDLMGQWKSSAGYMVARLRNGDGDVPLVTVHRLVVEAFVGPIPRGAHINHIDGCRTNNRLDNLEVVTPAANAEHAGRLGLLAHGEGHAASKLSVQAVREIRALAGLVSQTELSRRYGVHQSTISEVIARRAWRHVEDVAS